MQINTINPYELTHLSYITYLHGRSRLAVELSFEAKSGFESGFESTKIIAALVFLLDL
jgi:hypothetical protein